MASSKEELKMAVMELQFLKMTGAALSVGNVIICLVVAGQINLMPQIFINFLGLPEEYLTNNKSYALMCVIVLECFVIYTIYTANALEKEFKIEGRLKSNTIKFTQFILIISASTLIYVSAADVVQISHEFEKSLFWFGFVWMMNLPAAQNYYVVKNPMKTAQ